MAASRPYDVVRGLVVDAHTAHQDPPHLSLVSSFPLVHVLRVHCLLQLAQGWTYEQTRQPEAQQQPA